MRTLIMFGLALLIMILILAAFVLSSGTAHADPLCWFTPTPTVTPTSTATETQTATPHCSDTPTQTETTTETATITATGTAEITITPTQTVTPPGLTETVTVTPTRKPPKDTMLPQTGLFDTTMADLGVFTLMMVVCIFTIIAIRIIRKRLE